MSAALAVLVSGCALESAPLPPSLHIPVPVSNLTAVRAGDAVTLQWTMPERATDKVLLKGKQRVEICRLGNPFKGEISERTLEQATCEAAGNLMLLPGAQAKFVDPLPGALRTGAPRLLTYAARVYGPFKRLAGYSNRATVVAGAAPPAVGAGTARGGAGQRAPARAGGPAQPHGPSGAHHADAGSDRRGLPAASPAASRLARTSTRPFNRPWACASLMRSSQTDSGGRRQAVSQRTADRRRSGCLLASSWPIIPPIDRPMKWTRPMSSASSNPITSATRRSIE